jgi:hypothetical protein
VVVCGGEKGEGGVTYLLGLFGVGVAESGRVRNKIGSGAGDGGLYSMPEGEND